MTLPRLKLRALPKYPARIQGSDGIDVSTSNGIVTIRTTEDFAFDQLTINKNNSDDALTLTHPDSTDAAYDTAALAAIFINRPTTPTTRNFLSGIWVETDGLSTDKGRGIAVRNFGASDGIYLQNDGVGATGIASLLTTSATSATGGVFGTTLASQIGLVVRQETSVTPTADSDCLLSLSANGAVTEMQRLGSTVASQVGTVYRLVGAGSAAIVIKNGAEVTVGTWAADGVLTAVNVTATGSVFTTAAQASAFNLVDTGADHVLSVSLNENLSANRALTLVTGNANRAVTLNGNLTVSQTAILPGTVTSHLAGKIIGANFNTTADQSITLTYVGTRWRINSIFITNASVSLTTAAGGFYTEAAKAGTAIVAAGQAYSTLTTSTKLLTPTIANADVYSTTTLFFSLTTAQGSAATADIYVTVIPLDAF